jgi:hypothetical protein
MAKKKPFKRVLIIADKHCGHRVGLTPPDYQWNPESDKKWFSSAAKVQKGIWDWYCETIEKLKPIHRIIVNGDSIDGKGERSGSTEQITTDRQVQTDMAAECIRKAGASKVVIIKGTPYHTGASEDWEETIAYKTDAVSCSLHEYVDINGLIFSCKHFVGRSTVSHGQATALLRTADWNTLWAAEYKNHPRANIFIRSHVHYYIAVDRARYLAIITPALQGFGSKFGVGKCENVVDIGMLHFDVYEDGSYKCEKHLAELECMAVAPLKL